MATPKQQNTTEKTDNTVVKTTIVSEPLRSNIMQKTVQPLLLFDKQNYRLMIAGVAVIILGFALMAGGKNPNPAIFNDSEIYSFRRITLAPFLVIIGFAIEGYAIMKKPSSN